MIDGEFIRNFERVLLEQLESQLLSQHDIARHKAARGHEAQDGCRSALVIEQLNIKLDAILDAVVPARVPASDIKTSVPLLLLELGRRKIIPKEPEAARLRFRRGRDNSKNPEQCLSIDFRRRQCVDARGEAEVS